ncbi:hypothetical protein [Bacillus sp. SG-1]|uniref:hypothetical protein n=1 Tax=Bacillus sp. SG-1 TaxID=161544 RepID=UPI0001543D55|nr:hypothetical protein [Bacillus sp. SG-1]EDL64869.1 hypothetical protein BSG1_13806 [Bacillus sp. SG-1]
MKKNIILLLFLFAAAGTMYYYKQYNVKADKASVQNKVQSFINRGEAVEKKLEVMKIVQLDETNSYIAMFQLENGNIGSSHLEKGFNNRYKIMHAGYGTNEAWFEDVSTADGKYGVLIGKNSELDIDTIEAKLIHEEYSFSIDVSQQPVILEYIKLPKELTSTYPAEITLYNEQNQIMQ